MRGSAIARQCCILSLIFAATAFQVSGATLSFQGSFDSDDDLQFFNVSLSGASVVTFQTLSYGGGTNAAGTSISAGGFDPVLSLFQGTNDPNGLQLALENDSTCPPSNPDPITSACWDAVITISLVAGDYTLVLSQNDNVSFGPFLSDGFSRTGQGNFTGPTFLGTPGSFIDQTGAQRSSSWAVDILGVDDPTAIPEPSSLALLAMGSAAIALFRKRNSFCRTNLVLRKKAQQSVR